MKTYAQKIVINNFKLFFSYFLFLIFRVLSFSLSIYIIISISNFNKEINFSQIFSFFCIVLCSSLGVIYYQKKYLNLSQKMKRHLIFGKYKIKESKLVCSVVGLVIFEISSIIYSSLSNLYFFCFSNLLLGFFLFFTFQKISFKKYSLLSAQLSVSFVIIFSILILYFFEMKIMLIDIVNLENGSLIYFFLNNLHNYSFIFLLISVMGLRWMSVHLFNYPDNVLIVN
jgi:hypothetical protein